VGIDDSFFELGGDSILSFQIIAKAHRAGLRFTPKQLFQHPTVAKLAAVVGATQAVQVDQGVVTGALPLTPIQHWFFEQNFADPHHWNMALLLEVRPALNPALLERAVQQLLRHHDALRLRFGREESGWRQVTAAPDETAPVLRIDLSALAEGEQDAAMHRAAAAVQASLDLTQGPLLRVALVERGAPRASRLLLVAHHLVIDGVSWRIVLDDLQTAYEHLRGGQPVQLPAKTTSFQRWAQRLQQQAHSEMLQAEVEYWLGHRPSALPGLPVDYPAGPAVNTMGSARTVRVALEEAETRALLQAVPGVYRTQIDEVLLTAVVQAVTGWSGQRGVWVDVEGHGREEIVAEVDVSRTVGWFTTIYPVRLSLEEAPGPGEALKAIKEQLRRVPHRGIGYGMLRYLSGDGPVVERLRGLPEPEVSFNYLGQFDQVVTATSPFQLIQEESGPTVSGRARRTHLLEVTGLVIDHRLHIDWTYSENLHRRATIESLAQGFIRALRALIAHCQSPDVGGYTPSDFPGARLSQEALDGFLAKWQRPKAR
jgi:non-ribosomal peptide synthase protein (TIGR01720 family)